MPRDSTATKARILEAAVAEFSAHGLAGARVDRIAERAGANKQLIYAYFGSKEGLFDAAMGQLITQLVDAAPFDALNLPAYAVALFDLGRAFPDQERLLRWYLLERAGELVHLEEMIGSTRQKVAAVAAAQADGQLDATLPPEELLAMVLAIAQVPDDPPPRSVAQRRETIATAVRRLVTPASPRTRDSS